MLNRTIAPPISELPLMQLPDAATSTLSNGATLVQLDNGSQPVSQLTVEWPVGTIDVDSPAALRLWTSMLREGTANHTGSEIAELLESCGAWIRVDTSSHSTTLTVFMLNHTAPEVLPIVAEMITSPTFPTEILEPLKERQAAKCELDRAKIATKAVEASRILAFGADHPHARVALPEHFRAVERRHLASLHTSLALGTMPTIYLGGQLTSELTSLVTDLFSAIPFKQDALQRRIVPALTHTQSDTSKVTDADSLQTAVRMLIPTIDRSHPDYELLRNTVYALGGYFGSRLMSNIREDKGYTYGINASLSSTHEGAFITITCQCDNRYASAVVEEIENEISLLASEPMDPEELALVSSSITSSHIEVLDSPFSILSMHRLLREYSASPSYYLHQLRTARALTPADILRAAATYIAPSPRLLTLAGA